MLRNHSEKVVASSVNRCEQLSRNPSVCAVRFDQRRYRRGSKCHYREEYDQNSISECSQRPAVLEAVEILFLCLPVNPRDDVLHHSQWTDYRAIDPSEQQREQQQSCHNAEVQRQHSRNELNLCHPPEIEVNHSREVEEEEGDADEENCREGNSDFSEHFLMFLIVSHICLPQRGDYKNTAKLLRNLQKIHFLYGFSRKCCRKPLSIPEFCSFRQDVFMPRRHRPFPTCWR